MGLRDFGESGAGIGFDRSEAGGTPQTERTGGQGNTDTARPPETKRRGRPPKTRTQEEGSIGIPVLEPTENQGAIPTPQTTGKVGRPPKKSTTVKKAEELAQLTTSIQMLTCTGFGVYAGIAHKPIWIVTPEEAQPVAEPAARIVDRMGYSETTSKYTDYLMLMAGVAGIVIPRVLLEGQNKKVTNIRGLDDARPKQPEPSKPEVSRSDKSDNRPNGENNPAYVQTDFKRGLAVVIDGAGY